MDLNSKMYFNAGPLNPHKFASYYIAKWATPLCWQRKTSITSVTKHLSNYELSDLYSFYCFCHQSACNVPSLWAGTIFPVNLVPALTHLRTQFRRWPKEEAASAFTADTFPWTQVLEVPVWYQNILWRTSQVTQHTRSLTCFLKYMHAFSRKHDC